MTSDISFRVRGQPVTQGSMRAAVSKYGQPYLMQDHRSSLTAWRHAVNDEVRNAFAGKIAIRGAVAITLTFLLPRQKGHYGAKGLLPSAPALPTTRPDIDKLTRAVLDAMKGVAYLDDGQVVTLSAIKRFADRDDDANAVGLLANVREEV